jgi:plastocyanin
MNDIRPSTHRVRRWGAAALALLFVAALGACGGDDNGGDSGGGGDAKAADADATLDVTAIQYDDVSAPAGGTLAIKNSSGAAHTFTADDGAFDVSYGDGETVTVDVPKDPGEYKFHCEIHPNMQATLTAQ